MPRFSRRGKSKIHFVPTIADPSAPTRIEIDAGTHLTPEIAAVAGFSFSNSPIPTPDLDTTFTTTIPGEDTAADSSLTFYDDDTTGGSTIRTAMVKGTTGYIVLMPVGDVASERCEVWPVESTGVADEWTAGNDPARFTVSFGITAVPELDVSIPS